MKKIFTLATAVLATLALSAQTTYSYIPGDGTLNTTDFQAGLTIKTDGNQEFESVAHTDYAAFGSTSSTPNYAANKTIVYNCKTTETAIKIYAYNKNSSDKNLYITTFDEAASAFVNETIKVAKSGGKEVITKSYSNTTNKTIYLHVNSTDVQIFKYDVTESGTPLKQAGEIGYSFNFNKSRACLATSTTTEYNIEGMKIVGVSSNHTANNSTELQIKSTVTEGVITALAYVEFTAAANCQLHVKDNNGKGYWVSQTLAAGEAEDLIINKDTAVDVSAGKWYIISSDKGAIKFNLIEFLAPDLTPALSVSKTSAELKVTPAISKAEAKVKFTGKNLTPGTYDITVPSVAGLTVSPSSVTVGADGKVNAEVTLAYESAADQAEASADVTLSIDSKSATVTVTYSAVHEKNYGKSINIEQLVLDYGTGYDIKAALTAANIEYSDIDALDTLNDLEKKDNRNYAFLGLKLKKTNAKLACYVKAGDTITIKFGNVGADLKIRMNGMEGTLPKDQAETLGFRAPIDAFVEVITTSTATVVVKQIMVNENIADVTLPAPGAYAITLSAGEHGKLAATWEGKNDKKVNVPVGATVTLTATPDDNYKVTDVKVNGVSLNAEGGVYTFEMPAEEVTVTATFDEDIITAIDNTELSGNAQKMFENGQLVIIKNGVKYNAQGAIVK